MVEGDQSHNACSVLLDLMFRNLTRKRVFPTFRNLCPYALLLSPKLLFLFYLPSEQLLDNGNECVISWHLQGFNFKIGLQARHWD